MKRVLKGERIVFLCLFLLFGVISLAANASNFGPRHGGTRPPVQSVAEPAAIALLGAGLVSLGIYAKKKRGKKR